MMYYRYYVNAVSDKIIVEHKIPHMRINAAIWPNIGDLYSWLCIHEDNAAFAALCGLDLVPTTFINIIKIVHNPLFEIL